MEKVDAVPIKKIDGIEFYAKEGGLCILITDYHCKSIILTKQEVIEMLKVIPDAEELPDKQQMNNQNS